MASNLVSMEWVKEHLGNPEVRIIDCRFMLGQHIAGKEAYQEGHIPGAFYFDMEEDLSGSIKEHGGRHPLPDIESFRRKLEKAGIDENITIVAYDDQNGSMAARFWWLLQYLGHSKTYVMDGGFSRWVNKGYDVTTELPLVDQHNFNIVIQPQILTEMEEVKKGISNDGVVIIDSREEKRYLGLEETIDIKAGHIPSSKNYFWKDSMNDQGTWKTGKELEGRFKAIKESDEVIVYCGSGITACPNFLALKEAGFKNVKLYAGSWSDWITYPSNPIATINENE